MSCVEQKFPTRQSTIQNNPFGLRSTRNFGGLCIFLSAVLVVSQHFHGKKNGLETLLTSRGQNWYFLDREIRGINFRKNFGQVWNDFCAFALSRAQILSEFFASFPSKQF